MADDPMPLRALLERTSSPAVLRPRRRPRRRRRRPSTAVIMVLFAIVATILGVLIVPHFITPSPGSVVARPEPTLAPSPPSMPTAASTSPGSLTPTPATLVIDQTLLAAGRAPSLPWPHSGQAQVMISGVGVLGHSGTSRAVPIASVTKVMTAYTVLRDHPLGAGESGPTLTVSAAEAAAYPGQQAKLESLVVVAAGERISERDALKGLLIASGDNMAEILARWDAGSGPAFVARMNANARRLGMTSTYYADPAGLSSASVSTARDLLKLAPVAMAQPALAEIVAMTTASIPLNSLTNYNDRLGSDGIFGIKTGSTSVAGGCLLVAAHRRVSGHQMTIYGAVLGVSGSRTTILSHALDSGDALVRAAGDAVHRIVLLHAGETIVSLVDQQGTTVNLTVAKDVAVTGWSGQRFRFALPPGLQTGQVPAQLTIRTPTRSLTAHLIEQP